MNSKITLKLFLVLLFSSKIFSQTDPNIILIIADDMGWNQVSTPLTNLNNASDFYETPTLETLATEGIAFPQAYVNGANCAPTRSALLSGQYASRPHNNIFNVEDLNRGNTSSNSTLIGPAMGLASNGNIDEIPSSAITIAETLKTAGYTTAHFGKYHVGEYEDANVSNNAPKDQGFDFNYGGGTDGGPGSGGYFASLSAPYAFGSQVGPELDAFATPYTEAESIALSIDHANSPLTGTAKHLTDAMADAAMHFMDNNNTNPFFMHFSNYAIHGPFNSSDARPDLRTKYDTKATTYSGSMDHASRPGQAALAEGMDQAIGRLINYLKTTDDPRNPGKKLSENTLVYFIADNGDAIKRAPQAPLKGMKGEYSEGGIRSVTIAWSEASWLANKGTVNHTPVMAFDLYPTFAEMAGAALPGGGYDIDGVSQWQMLSNGTAMDSERPLYWHFPGYLLDSKRDSRPTSVIRKGDYKLRFNYESLSYEMYNLISDMGESTNLLSGNPDSATLILANQMSTLLRDHLINTNAPLPTYRSDGTTVPLPHIIDVSGVANSTDGCQAISGFEAYWDFDYASNTDDESGNNHNPIATTGAVQYDTEDFKEGDRSAIFDGFSKIQYDSDSFLKASINARSISLWVKPTGFSGIQNIFDEGGKTKGIALRLNATTLELIVRSNTTNFEEINAPFPNDNEWHQVALVYDGANTALKLFIDGAEVASSTNAPSSIGNHSGSGIGGKIGGADSFGNTSDNFFNGKMDAFAVYESVLTNTDIENGFCEETAPVVADAGLDVAICNGDTTTLTASGGTSYLWNTGATTASINVSPTVSTTYTVTVSDGITSDDDDVIVTVNSLPTANAGADVTICEGDSTILTASGGDSYLWSTGATTASIDISPNSTTTYSVTVTTNGCSSNDDVQVIVQAAPSADAGPDVTICDGGTATLTASGGGSYLWNTGATTASIDVSPLSTTLYSVTVTSNGCSTSDDVLVIVNSAPTADAGFDVSICEGDTTTLSASGGDSYLWNTGATTASIDVSPNSTTIYTVSVSYDECTESDSDDVIVTVNQLPNANAGADVTICEGDSTILTASGGDSYLWSTGATTASIDVSPNSTTTYSVTVTTDGCSSNDDVEVTVNSAPLADAGSDVSICEGETTTLTASGGTSYLWSTGATTASINVSPSSTSIYSVTVTSNGCSTNDDVTVIVNSIPVADAGADVTICDGESTTLMASGGDSYLWSNGATSSSINVSPGSTTVYSVTVTTNGCSSEDEVTVHVNPTPNANAGFDVTINEGDSTTLTATGGDSYLWSTGATTASIMVSPSSTTNYTVTVSQNGCTSNDDVLVAVIPIGGCNYTVINSEDFETGWGIWNDGGSDARRSSNDANYSNGTYSVRLRDDTSTSVTTTDNLDLTTYEEITIDFGYYPRSMDDSNEDFWMQISTDGGSNFTTIEEWNLNDEFVNDQFYTDQVVISGPFSSTTQFRFRADASGNSDYVYIDDIVISGCSNAGTARTVVDQQASSQKITKEEIVKSVEITSKLYPNPFSAHLIIEINGNYEYGKVSIFNLLGQTVYIQDIKEQQYIKIPAENLQSGQYIIRIDLDEKTMYKRAIKK